MPNEKPAAGPAIPAGRSPTEIEISRHAYALWEKAGSPEGSGGEHWLRAERELTEAAGAAGQSSTPYSASGSSSISGQGAGRS